MGKKGGKKGKVDNPVENAEPTLPTIPEEEEKNAPEVTIEEPVVIEEKEPPQRKSILKTKSASNVDIKRRQSSRTKSITIDETKTSQIEIVDQGEDQLEPIMETEPEVVMDTEVHMEPEQKQEAPPKGKKEKKEKPEKSDGDKAKKPPKKGKKGKKDIPEAEEAPVEVQQEVRSSVAAKEETEAPAEAVAEEGKPKKKGKKGKADKAEGETEEKEKKPKKDKKKKEPKMEDDGDKEEKPKEAKAKRASKLPVEGEGDAMRQSVDVRSPDKARRISKGEKRATVIAGPSRSDESLGKKKKRKSRASRSKSRSESVNIYKYRGSMRDSISEGSDTSERIRPSRISGIARASAYSGSLAEGHRRKLFSKTSTQSSESSIGTAEFRDEKEEDAQKGKGKKSKKQKGKKADEEKEEETEEEKERKKAEKLEAKKAKKAAAKAERKEKEAKLRAERGEKPKEPTPEDAKKKIEELKKMAIDMGVDETTLLAVAGEEQGPKKKASKKEKAKMTAEMAEKAKLELEAQAKKLEELIKKKKEEERLAAIEKDKKDTLEQGLRLEQLQTTYSVIQDIINRNAEITNEEKELLEWEKYVACGKLPNAAMCDQMNTYLHLWEIDLETTSIEDASNRTTDAIKLLSELEELIETVTVEDSHKLENWKWIRQLFRDHQWASLDVATYRLMRDVEHNLNRLNIPTADFQFKDDYVILCLWLRVMLPIPLPNPRRPPKPRIDVSFNDMNMSVLFPATIDCENAAIRAMYLKYDHLSDLSEVFYMPEVPEDYYMNLLEATRKEWRTKLKYKYDNRDKASSKPVTMQEPAVGRETEPASGQIEPEQTKREEERNIRFEEPEIGPNDAIPLVPFKVLKPTVSEHAMFLEDQLYNDTRINLQIECPENVINLRKFAILGGAFHLNLLAQPPQPQDFITMEMTITGLYLPKKLEVLPFKVIYTPYIPQDPVPRESTAGFRRSRGSSFRKLPEELEEEIKKQEDELDKLISINIKWPPHVIFLELPIVCRWDDENKQWSNEEIYDVKHNEDKCMISFRTGVFGIYGLAAYRYSNLPFQAYDIKPELDDSVTVQLTAAILMLEFNIKDGLIAITQLQNSPNMTLQDIVGKYMKLHRLTKLMKEAGIDIFPTFDAFCYVEGCCEKQWAMEQHLYYNMAQISNSFNFAWSRWNLQAGRRKIVVQMRQYSSDKGKQKNHQMLLVTPLKATFIECTEVSQAFSEQELESLKFCADLYHLMKNTSGIFVRNKVSKACNQNIYTLAQFLISIRILSFS